MKTTPIIDHPNSDRGDARLLADVAKRVTRAQVLAAVRRRLGPKAFLYEQRGADTRAQRDAKANARKAALERIRDLQERTAAIESTKWLENLLVKARFVVDVGGDDPSIPQLQKALEVAEEFQRLRAAGRDARAERDQAGWGTYRWQAVDDSLRFARTVHHQTDTLEEMLAWALAPKAAS